MGDLFGYTCLYFIGGRTGINNEDFNLSPMVSSCEKMCFPTNIMDNYIDDMFLLFYEPEIIEGDDDDDVPKSNPLNIFNRDKYTVWVIMSAIIIIFVTVCLILLIHKMKKDSDANKQQQNNENTPLLFYVNNSTI